MSILQYVVPIELYSFMILFHFNSQSISVYYKNKKKWLGLPQLALIDVPYADKIMFELLWKIY